MEESVQTTARQRQHSFVMGCVATLFALSCCGVFLTGWVRGYMVALRGSQQIVSHLDDGVGLVVEADQLAHVTVRPADSATVLASLTGSADDGSHQFRFIHEATSLRLRVPPDTAEATLLLNVPRDAPVTIQLATGVIELTGMSGAFTLSLGEGRIVVHDHAANGALSATIGNGEMNITLRTIDDDSSVHLEAAQGNVTLQVPDGIGFALDAATQQGILDVAGVSVTPTTSQRSAQGETLVGSATPERGRRLTVVVGSGDILLRAR